MWAYICLRPYKGWVGAKEFCQERLMTDHHSGDEAEVNLRMPGAYKDSSASRNTPTARLGDDLAR